MPKSFDNVSLTPPWRYVTSKSGIRRAGGQSYAARRETVRCREIVAAEPGAPPASFAHPYGYSTRRVRRPARAAGFAQALAVGNALAPRRQGPYALERVTARRGTGAGEFAGLVEGRAVARAFAVDRALTKGFAVVRGARRAVRGFRGSGPADTPG